MHLVRVEHTSAEDHVSGFRIREGVCVHACVGVGIHFAMLKVSESFLRVVVMFPSTQHRVGEVQLSGPGTVTFIWVWNTHTHYHHSIPVYKMLFN